MLRSNRTRADVVQRSIIGLSDDWIDRSYVRHAGLLEHPADQCVGSFPNAKRAGQEQRSFELAELSELGDARDFAESIPNVKRRGHTVGEEISSVRQNRGHARPHRIPFDDRRLSDADPRHVGDRIELARGKNARFDAEISRPGPLGVKRWGDSGHGQDGYSEVCAEVHGAWGERLNDRTSDRPNRQPLA
jgi:hypothetical protein